MSSPSRNQNLEAILEARWEASHAESGKADLWAHYELLLDKAREGTHHSRSDIDEAIKLRFIEYSRNRLSYERPRSSRPR